MKGQLCTSCTLLILLVLSAFLGTPAWKQRRSFGEAEGDTLCFLHIPKVLAVAVMIHIAPITYACGFWVN